MGSTILAVGILAVAQMQVISIQGIDQSGEGSVAVQFAREQAERIINMDYTDADLADNNLANNANLANGVDTGGWATATQFDNHQVARNDPNSGQYTVIWNVADSAVGAAPYKQVVVIVLWTRKGVTRTRAISCIKPMVS